MSNQIKVQEDASGVRNMQIEIVPVISLVDLGYMS